MDDTEFKTHIRVVGKFAFLHFFSQLFEKLLESSKNDSPKYQLGGRSLCNKSTNFI